MPEFKPGDNLPCFKYIIANIKDTNVQTPTAFALAYLQYLEKCGITDVKVIDRAFQKITLMAQFNRVGRTTPLDLLSIKGKTYKLDSEESLSAYRAELFKVCKEPRSFSALYKSADSKYYSCKFCPMSEHYTLSHQEQEYAFAKYALTDIKHFNKAITSIDDIDKLFLSYNELYRILNNILKPYSFPGLKILFSTIYTKTDAYFNALLQIKDYSYISKNFTKELRQCGIRSEIENIGTDYDVRIYDYLLEQMEKAPTLTDEEMLSCRETLLHRENYQPLFDADSTPAIASDNNKKKATKTIKKGKKRIDTYEVKSALSYSIDKEMASEKNAPDTPLKEYTINGAIETEPTVNIPIPSDVAPEEVEVEMVEPASTDVLSEDGEILVEHTIAEGYENFGFDDEMDYDLSDDDMDYELEEEFAQVQQDESAIPDISNESVLLHKNADSGTAAIISPAPPAETLETGNENTPDVSLVEEDNLGVSQESNTAVAEPLSLNAETGKGDSTEASYTNDTDSSAEWKYAIDELRYPYSCARTELDSILEVVDSSILERYISYSLADGFCIMEPVCFTDTTGDYVLLYAKKSICKVSLQSGLIPKFLKNHRYKIGCVRPLALYSVFARNEVRLHRTDSIVPLDVLMYRENISIFKESIQEQLSYTYRLFSSIYMKETHFYCSEMQHEAMLLYSAYGNSLLRSRFLTLKNPALEYALCYDEEQNIISTDFTYQSEIPLKSGIIFHFSYESNTSDTDKKLYEDLTKSVLLRLCEKACFNKFNLSLLSFSSQKLVLFADEYCSDYIFNVVLMHLFKEGTQHGIYPLNISLKKIKLDAEVDKTTALVP